ncbi:MAG: pyruvate kinase alpha/beta domain-containing protein [Anaerolineae bacterium]
MELKTLSFETPGEINTEATLNIVKERAQTLGIKQVVVASSHGSTARQAHGLLAPLGIQVIAVTLCHSWESEGWPMTPEEKAELIELGVQVHTGIHALGDDVGSAFSDKHGGRTTPEIVRDTLYRFCQGMKVAVECLLMAADAGYLEMDQEVIAVAGTSSGADTAIVCKPAYPRTFFDLEIREVLAKPRRA